MAEQDKPQQEKPRIVVDDDWKAQAQAEKERLARQAQEPQAPSAKGEAEAEPRELPRASFSVLVSSLVTQIIFCLGGVEDPKTRQRFVDLDLAKHHVDMLAMLEEKTRGNLSDEEKKLLDQALYEMRMTYVQVAQAASRVTAPGGKEKG